MGSLFYSDGDRPVQIPDRLLAHLKVVMTTKLRRDESFTLNWHHAPDEPGGRSSIWLQSSIPLRFVFDAPEAEPLDVALLSDLAHAANTAAGLTVDLRDEPVAIGAPRRRAEVAQVA